MPPNNLLSLHLHSSSLPGPSFKQGVYPGSHHIPVFARGDILEFAEAANEAVFMLVTDHLGDIGYFAVGFDQQLASPLHPQPG